MKGRGGQPAWHHAGRFEVARRQSARFGHRRRGGAAVQKGQGCGDRPSLHHSRCVEIDRRPPDGLGAVVSYRDNRWRALREREHRSEDTRLHRRGRRRRVVAHPRRSGCRLSGARRGHHDMRYSRLGRRHDGRYRRSGYDAGSTEGRRDRQNGYLEIGLLRRNARRFRHDLGHGRRGGLSPQPVGGVDEQARLARVERIVVDGRCWWGRRVWRAIELARCRTRNRGLARLSRENFLRLLSECGLECQAL